MNCTNCKNPIQKIAETCEWCGLKLYNNINLEKIYSQLDGEIYFSHGPNELPFIKIGSIVNSGSVLYVIQSDFLFHEFESQHSGKVIDILVGNKENVCLGQPLIIIELENSLTKGISKKKCPKCQNPTDNLNSECEYCND